jgi:hypothetical protein
MKTYTFHLPRDARPGDPAMLEQAVFVKDGFAWGAFIFNVLWFLFHRLWLATLIVFVLLTAFNLLLNLLGVHPTASVAAHFLVSLLIGFEAGSLRRWTLERHGMPAVDVVTANDLSEAETKAFERWLARTSPALVARPAVAAPGPARRSDVIGLFPDAERPL